MAKDRMRKRMVKQFEKEHVRGKPYRLEEARILLKEIRKKEKAKRQMEKRK